MEAQTIGVQSLLLLDLRLLSSVEPADWPPVCEAVSCVGSSSKSELRRILARKSFGGRAVISLSTERTAVASKAGTSVTGASVVIHSVVISSGWISWLAAVIQQTRPTRPTINSVRITTVVFMATFLLFCFFFFPDEFTIAVAFCDDQLRDSRGYTNQIPTYSFPFVEQNESLPLMMH